MIVGGHNIKRSPYHKKKTVFMGHHSIYPHSIYHHSIYRQSNCHLIFSGNSGFTSFTQARAGLCSFASYHVVIVITTPPYTL